MLKALKMVIRLSFSVCLTVYLVGIGNAFEVDQMQNQKIENLEKKVREFESRLSAQPQVKTVIQQVESKKDQHGPKITALEKKYDEQQQQSEKRDIELEKRYNALEERLKASGSSSAVEVTKGSLKLSGILQTVFSVTEGQAVNTSFSMKRLRLIGAGAVVPSKVNYFIQLEMMPNTDATLEASPGLGLAGGPRYAPILDAKMSFFYIPKTEVAFGRFVPAFTYYMPSSTAKLDFVNYPLVTTKYWMLRQVGVQSTTKVTKDVGLTAGLFNGYPLNNLADNNNGKDGLVSTNIKLSGSLSLLGYGWLGNVIPGSSTDEIKNRFGGGILYDRKISKNEAFSFKGEYIAGSDKSTAGVETKSMGLYAQTAFKVSQRVELLARYDLFDPNMSVTNDGLRWLTGGMNYYILGQNVMFYLNYVNKLSEGITDPKDDEIVFQAQILF